MPILDALATTIGSAVRAYQTALHGEVKTRRPAFLNDMAQAEKWKGGDLGEKDAAYRRSLQNSWIYTAINYKANELASGRLYVAKSLGGLDDDTTPLPAHPFTRLLNRPNPLMGRGFLWQYTHWWQDLAGQSFWFLAPDEYGYLGEIWPLPANLVNPFPGDNERMVDYYEYTPNGRMWRIPAEYICHFRYPNPYDYYRGLSPLIAALLPADADSAMAHWNGAFFGSQNVMPSAVVNVSSGVPGQTLDPQDVEAIKEQLTSGEYAATQRRTVVASAYDMAVSVLGWSAKDMDFLAGREFTKEEILNIYGIPAGLLDKNATEANATVADNVFKEKTLWPLMTNVYADSITAQILDRWYAPGIMAMFKDIRPVNKAQLIQEASASLPDLTRAERRARFWNLKPLGDERDKEIPGAAQPAPYPPVQDVPELSNPQNAVPPAARSLVLSQAALSDLRRWKEVAAKSLKNGKRPPEFVSQTIPVSVSDGLRADLLQARTADDARQIFQRWTSGEASTKAAPFPTGQPSNTRSGDDPYQPVKQASAQELEIALNLYFGELAQRIAEQVGE